MSVSNKVIVADVIDAGGGGEGGLLIFTRPRDTGALFPATPRRRKELEREAQSSDAAHGEHEEQ